MSDGQGTSSNLAVLQLQLENLKEQLQESRASDRALFDQQLRSLRESLTTVASRHETFASAAAVEKLESQVQGRLDLLGAKQDGLVANINQLQQLVTKLTDEMSSSEQVSRLEEARGNERRNRLVAVIATGTAVASLVFGEFIHHGGGTNTVYVPAPLAATTTTTTPGHP